MEKRLQLWSPVWGWLATKEGESVDLKGQDLVLYETAIQEALEQEKLYYRKKSAPFNLMDYYDADDSVKEKVQNLDIQVKKEQDALQWAGWIWRGTAVWDKGNSRPQKGRFRQQAEYIVWGSNGPMPINRPVSCLPGVFRYGNPQNRIHVTEKPLQLMKDVIQICEPGGRILDPFAGAGTTILVVYACGTVLAETI